MSVTHQYHEPVLVDPELDRQLREEGYGHVPLLGPKKAADLGRSIASLYGGEVQSNQAGSNWFFGLLDQDLERARVAAQLVWDEVVPLLATLFSDARCHYASVALKSPGAEPTPIHQHWPSTVDPFARRIGCWILLSNGGSPVNFRLVPRSHQLLPFVRYAGSEDYFGSFSIEIERDHARDIPVRCGEAILFEDSILHGTSANGGPELRVAALANFIGRDMEAARVVPDPDGGFGVLRPVDEVPTSAERPLGQHAAKVRKVATLANRNRTITEAEFEQLRALGRKATLDFDPLDLIRGQAAPAPAPAPAPASGSFRQAVTRQFRQAAARIKRS